LLDEIQLLRNQISSCQQAFYYTTTTTTTMLTLAIPLKISNTFEKNNGKATTAGTLALETFGTATQLQIIQFVGNHAGAMTLSIKTRHNNTLPLL
jgi:hypothetical protein